jgi:hypothetical protein
VPRFALFTDANVDGRLIRTLIQRGWPVHRSVDTFVEDEDDDVIFEHAAKKNLVFVTNDEDLLATGKRWLETDRSFRMIYWEKRLQDRVSIGSLLEKFEKLADEQDPFLYPSAFCSPGGLANFATFPERKSAGLCLVRPKRCYIGEILQSHRARRAGVRFERGTSP